MLKLSIDGWLVPLVQSKDVKSRVRVDNRYREEFGVGVGIHQGSVLLLIIVLEALVQGLLHMLSMGAVVCS